METIAVLHFIKTEGNSGGRDDCLNMTVKQSGINVFPCRKFTRNKYRIDQIRPLSINISIIRPLSSCCCLSFSVSWAGGTVKALFITSNLSSSVGSEEQLNMDVCLSVPSVSLFRPTEHSGSLWHLRGLSGRSDAFLELNRKCSLCTRTPPYLGILLWLGTVRRSKMEREGGMSNVTNFCVKLATCE